MGTLNLKLRSSSASRSSYFQVPQIEMTRGPTRSTSRFWSCWISWHGCVWKYSIPPNSYFDRENDDNPMDLGVHYFQTNPHGRNSETARWPDLHTVTACSEILLAAASWHRCPEGEKSEGRPRLPKPGILADSGACHGISSVPDLKKTGNHGWEYQRNTVLGYNIYIYI